MDVRRNPHAQLLPPAFNVFATFSGCIPGDSKGSQASLIILLSTWGLFRESLDLVLHAVPAGIDTEAVETYLTGLPGIDAVHDLPVWAMSTTETALTAHLVKPDPDRDDVMIVRIQKDLHDRFEIDHVTIQWERADCYAFCSSVSCDISRPCSIPDERQGRISNPERGSRSIDESTD